MPVSDLVVEDGTGLATADAYVSVENADKYFVDRGVNAWATLTLDQKIVAIRRATDFIEEQYADEFAGFRTFPAMQSLSFPRNGQVGILPVFLVRATLELALIAASGDLYIQGDDIAAERVLVEERKKLGPLEKTLRYADATSAPDFTAPTIRLSRVDALLAPLLVRSTGFLPVVRA